MKPILKKPPTFCINCNSNSIDIFNQYNSPINYFDIIKYSNSKEEIISELDRRKHLSYMRCTKCGKEYRIDWTSNIPRPLYDERTENCIKTGTIIKYN